MGASKQKKIRQQQREEGVEKRQLAAEKAKKEAKTRTWKITLVVILIVILTIPLFVFNSPLLHRNFTAVTIGDVQFNAAEFSFYYRTAYFNFLNANSQFLELLGLNPNAPLHRQPYPLNEEMTWADHFRESALNTMRGLTMLYLEARDAGFELSEEARDELEFNREMLRNAYQGTGFRNINAYLAAVYGRGVNFNIVSRLIEREFIAHNFHAYKMASFTYTESELEAFYAERADEFDRFIFLSYFVDGTEPDEPQFPGIEEDLPPVGDDPGDMEYADDEEDEGEEPQPDDRTSMERARDLADAIIARTEAESAPTGGNDEDPDADTADPTGVNRFINAVYDLTGAWTSPATTQGVNLPSLFAEWLLDETRTAGDMTIIETETGYHVLYFAHRENNNYRTVNVRHILIMSALDEYGNCSEEAEAEARARAEEILAQWLEGDADEDSFAELANAYSDDHGSNTRGGLYEDIFRNQMVPAFNDWCFDEARQPGDTGIVFNKGAYCGYHIIYFVGHGALHRHLIAEGHMRAYDYTAWETTMLENYPAVLGFTARFVR